MSEDTKAYNYLKTPEERQAWIESGRVWVIPGCSKTVSYPNGVSYGGTTSTQQSKETTEMMKRSLERQYKEKELMRRLFGGGFR